MKIISGNEVTVEVESSPSGDVTAVTPEPGKRVIFVSILGNGDAIIEQGAQVKSVLAPADRAATGGVEFEANNSFSTLIEINGPVVLTGNAGTVCSRRSDVTVQPIPTDGDLPPARATVGSIFSGKALTLTKNVTVEGNIVAVGDVHNGVGVYIRGRAFSLEGDAADLPDDKVVKNLKKVTVGKTVVYTDGDIRKQESRTRLENASVVISRNTVDGTTMLVTNYYPEQNSHSIAANIRQGYIQFEPDPATTRTYMEFNGTYISDFESARSNWRLLDAAGYTEGVRELAGTVVDGRPTGLTSDAAAAARAIGVSAVGSSAREAEGQGVDVIPRPGSEEANVLCAAAFTVMQETESYAGIQGRPISVTDIQRTYRQAYVATMSGSGSDLERMHALDVGTRIAEAARSAANPPEHATGIIQAFENIANRIVTVREEAARTLKNVVTTSRGSTISHS